MILNKKYLFNYLLELVYIQLFYSTKYIYIIYIYLFIFFFLKNVIGIITFY